MILPFVDQAPLYETIDLTKPWDDPINAEAHAMTLAVYSCPSTNIPPGQTVYLGVVGSDCFFHPKKARTFSEMTDGTSNTLAVVEVSADLAIHWMEPRDIDPKRFLKLNSKSDLPHQSGSQTLLADGSVRWMSHDISEEQKSALVTIAADDGQFEERESVN